MGDVLCFSDAEPKSCPLQYVDGKPPVHEHNEFLYYENYFRTKYEFILFIQKSMKYFPPRTQVNLWISQRILTTQRAKRRRRKRVRDDGMLQRPGEGWEMVLT